jgi:hypothetical protein
VIWKITSSRSPLMIGPGRVELGSSTYFRIAGIKEA